MVNEIGVGSLVMDNAQEKLDGRQNLRESVAMDET